jgi:outer membrane protein OmpA-like peptidoglycan-associated protein
MPTQTRFDDDETPFLFADPRAESPAATTFELEGPFVFPQSRDPVGRIDAEAARESRPTRTRYAAWSDADDRAKGRDPHDQLGLGRPVVESNVVVHPPPTGRIERAFLLRNFKIDGAALRDDHRAYLADVATWMKGRGHWRVFIEAHSSRIGTRRQEDAISEDRYLAARAYLETELKRLGADLSGVRIAGEGLGFRHSPVAAAGPEARSVYVVVQADPFGHAALPAPQARSVPEAGEIGPPLRELPVQMAWEAEASTCAPSCEQPPRIIVSGFPEYAVTPDKLDKEQRGLLQNIASTIIASSTTSKPVVAIVVRGHADVALRKPSRERQAFELDISKKRAQNAMRLIREEVNRQLGGQPLGTIDAIIKQVFGVGSTEQLILLPTTEAERRLNRRVEVLLSQCTPRARPPGDTANTRIERLLKLLETRRLLPENKVGALTSVAKCTLEKLLSPDVSDLFIDGAVSMQVINGKTPKQDSDVYVKVPIRNNLTYIGNYGPMPPSEFIKFFGQIRPIVDGDGFSPCESDDKVLQGFGEVMRRIDLGLSLLRLYQGYAGPSPDSARQRLVGFSKNHKDTIYGCFSSE